MHFTQDEPDQQLFTDVGNLNNFTNEQFGQFVGICLSFLAGQSTAQDDVTTFAQQHGVKEKALNNIIKGILSFFAAALQKNMSPAHVEEDLTALGLEAEKATLLNEQWKSAFVALNAAMVKQTLSVDELVDMEWKFGVTASNDELGNVGACFLQLKLKIDRGGGHKEDVLMELSLPQFYKFLQEMKTADRHCRGGEQQ
jgi:hypothetical protein